MHMDSYMSVTGVYHPPMRCAGDSSLTSTDGRARHERDRGLETCAVPLP
eukprot:COSAG03_NODE_21808_length_299_cov_0.735000_1_plen_48_part_10